MRHRGAGRIQLRNCQYTPSTIATARPEKGMTLPVLIKLKLASGDEQFEAA